MFRSSCPEVFCKKDVLRNFTKFTGKRLCQGNKVTYHLFLNFLSQSLFFIKKETLAQVFSCEFYYVLRNFIKKMTLAQAFSFEFCEIFKNTCFYRTPLVAASAIGSLVVKGLFAMICLHFQ